MADLLGKIMSKCSETAGKVSEAPQSKKRKVQTATEDPFQCLSQFLMTVQGFLQKMQPEQKGQVEVEARLGLITERGVRACKTTPGAQATALTAETMRMEGYRFVSGVDPVLFSKVQDSLRKGFPQGVAGESSMEEHAYVLGNGERVIWSPRLRRGTKERKVKMYEITLVLPSASYDLRVSVSQEQPSEDHNMPPTDFQQKRVKRRTSTNLQQCSWRVDLTDVETEGGSVGMARGREQTNEVEFELHSADTLRWIEVGAAGAQSKEAVQATSQLASQLWQIVQCANPLETISSLAPTKAIEDYHFANEARDRCRALRMAITGKPGRQGQEFPGAMPVNLCRRHLAAVQKGNYHVTEKTDGARYLLVVVRGEGKTAYPTNGVAPDEAPRGQQCVLVDRKMTCHELPCGGAEVAACFPPGTVFDGELVHSLGMKQTVFMVFDLLAHGGELMVDQLFAQRWQMLTEKVLEPYHRALQESPCSLPQNHTPIIKKMFFPRQKVSELFRCFKMEDGSRVYRQSDKRHHRSDGLIFQPNDQYQVGAHKELLKWKWLDTVTIDLQVSLGRRGENAAGGASSFSSGIAEGDDEDYSQTPGVYLACGGPEGTQLDVSQLVQLPRQDVIRLLADIKGHEAGPIIAEIAFDVDTGMWTYKMLRVDKHIPNYVGTVMNTMVELAEAIGPEELHYRMLISHPFKDDWSRQLSKMQQKAVQFRCSAPI